MILFNILKISEKFQIKLFIIFLFQDSNVCFCHKLLSLITNTGVGFFNYFLLIPTQPTSETCVCSYDDIVKNNVSAFKQQFENRVEMNRTQ